MSEKERVFVYLRTVKIFGKQIEVDTIVILKRSKRDIDSNVSSLSLSFFFLFLSWLNFQGEEEGKKGERKNEKS